MHREKERKNQSMFTVSLKEGLTVRLLYNLLVCFTDNVTFSITTCNVFNE